MREKFGKAIYWVGYADRVPKKDQLTPDLAWDRCGPVQREFNLKQVDALLAAMMEPSEGMLDAGGPGRNLSKAMWQAMLKAAGDG